VRVAPGGSIQAAVNAATVPGTIIYLQAGGLYRESVIVPKPNVGVTLMTEGFAIGDRAVLPTDAPAMATMQPTAGQSYAVWVMANGTRIQGVRFLAANGNGELVRVGDNNSAVLADVPDGVTLAQNYLQGDPVAGQKRGIAANGSRLLIDQNYAENIWANQQDSQCVAVFSTPGPVTITRNIFGCASENIIVGGTPPAGPEFLPSDIEVGWNVLYKPLAWQGPAGTTPPAKYQIKNLFELKVAKRVHVHHNLMVNNWVQAQPGMSVLATIAPNGTCGVWCVLEDVTFENNIVWNVSGGFSVQGYYPDLPQSGQTQRVTVRNNLWYIRKAMGGSARVFQITNEPKDVTFDRNTIIHDGTSVVMAAEYGKKWIVGTPAAVPGGPVQGFRFTGNLTRHGAPPPSTASYGIFTKEGFGGLNLGVYFPGAVVAGNVFGGATAKQITAYNVFAGVTPTNRTQPWAAFDAEVNTNRCPTSTFIDGFGQAAGADCSTLPWALFDLLPASAK